MELNQIAVTIVAIVLVVWLMRSRTSRMHRVAQMLRKQTYDKAIQKGDKAAALEAGRAYYRSLRNGKKLTAEDEKAIENDLSNL